VGNERVSKPVGRTVAGVSAEEHMANYRAARALMGKAKSSPKKGARKSAVKNGAKGMSDMAGGLGSRPGKSA
jgi:hypothetical protein